jgi:hypothetical protein
MSNIGDPVGPFTISGSFIMFHNHRLDPASKGRYLMRLPDRTLVWLDDYEQRMREFQSEPISAPLRDEKDC